MPLGRGDDCAVMTTPHEICVSTDVFLEDVHFRRSYFTPEDIGHKALAVNISDIAAMGAKPLAFSMGLMLPKGIERDYVQRMMQGMADLARCYDLALSGGDISRATSLGFSITIYGEAVGIKGSEKEHGGAKGNKFLQRGTCHEGDIVFILGDIGLARVGLLSLEVMGRTACSLYPTACQAHLAPLPLVEAGRMLAAYEDVSLMDVSDGLARDVPRLLGYGHGTPLGADLRITADMLHADVLAFAKAEVAQENALVHVTADAVTADVISAKQIADRAIHHALLGGEDYALLGACSPALFDKLRQHLADTANMPALHRLGVVTTGPVTLNGHAIHGSGFDHFS